jgi:hypothetical protein
MIGATENIELLPFKIKWDIRLCRSEIHQTKPFAGRQYLFRQLQFGCACDSEPPSSPKQTPFEHTEDNTYQEPNHQS